MWHYNYLMFSSNHGIMEQKERKNTTQFFILTCCKQIWGNGGWTKIGSTAHVAVLATIFLLTKNFGAGRRIKIFKLTTRTNFLQLWGTALLDIAKLWGPLTTSSLKGGWGWDFEIFHKGKETWLTDMSIVTWNVTWTPSSAGATCSLKIMKTFSTATSFSRYPLDCMIKFLTLTTRTNFL